MPIYNATAIIAAANHPEIRLFAFPKARSTVPATVIPNGTLWVQTTPNTIPSFSAVCYLTALEWQRLSSQAGGATGSTPRPMGLIRSAVGSTDVQSWMSAHSRETARTGCWAGPGGYPPAELPPSQSHDPPDGSPASSLWNGMVAPLVPYAIAAVLWDQGENNAHYCSAREYNCLFATMVASWRAAWGYAPAELPFGFVQIGSYAMPPPFNNSVIRFGQSETLPAGRNCYDNQSVTVGVVTPAPNTGMAVTYDLGSPQPGHPNGTWWIHCRNKTAVGRRLAAAVHALSHPNTAWSGPVVRSARVVMTTENRPTVVLQFASAEGLRLEAAQGCVSCCDQAVPASGGPPREALFQVANRNGVWLSAQGTVTGETQVTVTPDSLVPHAWVGIFSILAERPPPPGGLRGP